MADVRLVDLEVIKRYSLAVRQEHADAAELLAVLEADREELQKLTGASSRGAGASGASGAGPAAKRSAAKKRPAKKRSTAKGSSGTSRSGSTTSGSSGKRS